jgi:hypothetical protein
MNSQKSAKGELRTLLFSPNELKGGLWIVGWKNDEKLNTIVD